MFILSLFVTINFIIAASSTVLQGSFINQQLYSFVYTVPSSSLYVNFQLDLTPFYTSALLVGRSSPFSPPTTREEWLHSNSRQTTDCDFEAMVTGHTQYGWVQNKGVSTKVYFNLVNFDPSKAFNYTIRVSPGNSWLESCSGGLKGPGTQYCQFCDSGHVGEYCNIKRQGIVPSANYYLNVPAESYMYFVLLTKAQEIDLSLSFNGSALVYIQHQERESELAGVVNYLPSSQGKGMYEFGKESSASIDVATMGHNLLIGVINPNPNTLFLSLTFQEKSQINYVLIIASVVGGILFIGILVGILIITKKKNTNRMIVIPDPFPTNESTNCTNRQIQLYFPAVCCKLISHFENWFQKQDESEQSDPVQCIICLSSITRQQLIRAGYCKHFFHDDCLLEWFKKQQNCPYCRCDFRKESTRERYKILAQKAGKVLRGEQIVRSIFGNDAITMTNMNINEISQVIIE